MRVLDKGHVYWLNHLDGPGNTVLTFVKREGPGYPGNLGHWEGTNIQEVIRALIDRTKYVDNQIHSHNNSIAINHFREALKEFEIRAAIRHSRPIPNFWVDVENMATCQTCGHIGCVETLHNKET